MDKVHGPSEMFANLFKIPELRKKALFTLLILAVYRFGSNIPVPGIDTVAFTQIFREQQQGSWVYGFLGVYNALSAGNLFDFTIFSLGIMPYISAEIIFQLLTKVVPQLEEIQKEGQSGQRRIRMYSRIATIPICILQAIFTINLLTSRPELAATIIIEPEWLFQVIAVITMTAGCYFLIWLGDQITEKGIGNGVSLLIQAGIIASIPNAVISLMQPMLDSKVDPQASLDAFLSLVTLVVMFTAITAGVVIITLARREIVIQHAKHVRGSKVAGGQRQTFPLRIDQAGVIPIIFASALMTLPLILFGLLEQVGAGGGFWGNLMTDAKDAMNQSGFSYTLGYIVLIFFFTYFWTQLQFNPIELAKNFKEWGAFIPGVRPGKDTVTYLSQILRRMTLAGATFLCLVAVVPVMIPEAMHFVFGDSESLSQNRMFFRFMGGTGILIVVHVALDLIQKIEVQLIQRNYDAYTGMVGQRRR
ncbi:MAG: preprotein translocase subunit SecY [Planctomycetaceae bacterium]|nr:Protein translocase subunit SecY [Planctomycetota bacterium]MCQ3950913.1 preprotein translocase subunit SecY [Planctomycetota bacterium]NUO15910.1 preprotein translocase subunit SecY [Planctomycetaceae bacterium]GIK53628.1 MAG: protein translocase subunit SecY [Planctomycetota bacterium]